MANIEKIQEISKPRSAESLKKEFQYKKNKKMARIMCGCEYSKENGTCLENTIGCHKCELFDNYIAAMAMANWKDKQFNSDAYNAGYNDVMNKCNMHSDTQNIYQLIDEKLKELERKMTNKEILNELKNISVKADEICELIFDLTTSKQGLSELSELKKISAKADDLCEEVFDLRIEILGNWIKIAYEGLPREDGDYLLVMKTKYDTKEGTSKPYMNVSHFSMKDGWKDPYGEPYPKETILIAWMELPKYTEGY